METTTPPPDAHLGETAIAKAMAAATRDLPPGAAPLGPPGEAAIPSGELKADGYHSEGFVFPEPTTVGYQAIAVLTQKLGGDPEQAQNEMVTANRLALGVAWISWAIRNDHQDKLLDYATGGEVTMAEAARAMNAEVPGAGFAAYMKAAASYLKWVASAFLKGQQAPEVPPSEGSPEAVGEEAPPSDSSS